MNREIGRAIVFTAKILKPTVEKGRSFISIIEV